MLPVQTAMIRYGFDDGDMQLSMIRGCRFVNGTGGSWMAWIQAKSWHDECGSILGDMLHKDRR